MSPSCVGGMGWIGWKNIEGKSRAAAIGRWTHPKAGEAAFGIDHTLKPDLRAHESAFAVQAPAFARFLRRCELIVRPIRLIPTASLLAVFPGILTSLGHGNCYHLSAGRCGAREISPNEICGAIDDLTGLPSCRSHATIGSEQGNPWQKKVAPFASSDGKKAKGAVPTAGSSQVADINLAANAAAAIIANKKSPPNPSAPKKESAAFKQLKAGLNKPAAGAPRRRVYGASPTKEVQSPLRRWQAGRPQPNLRLRCHSLRRPTPHIGLIDCRSCFGAGLFNRATLGKVQVSIAV